MRNIVIILALALGFHFLIWEARLGSNLLLFSLATSAAALWLKPEISRRPMTNALLIGWCLSGFFVFWHHSILSIVVYWVFAAVTVGYLQNREVRFWVLGLVESARGLLFGWLISLRNLSSQQGPDAQWKTTWRQVRLWIIPFLLIIPFYLIYSAANSTFGAFNERMGDWIEEVFDFDFDMGRLFVFLLGWILVVALLGRRNGIPLIHDWVQGWQFALIRNRRPLPWSTRTLGLKQEYQTAVYSFIILNSLLLIINLLDVIWVWFSPQEYTAAELSQYVHEGTWLLIFSIVLAMLVVLLFMRGNLNFFPNNQRLKQLANLWLAQNAFLALSVGVRNGHYIQHHGLAHGRIIVVVFLVLVLFGLYTMYQKIRGPRTAFYLMEMNGRAVLLSLLVAASVNWDSLITRYNLQREDPDLYHIQQILDNNLVPLLEAAQTSTMIADRLDHDYLQSKAKRLERRVENRDWRSWNYSDYRQLKAWRAYQKAN